MKNTVVLREDDEDLALLVGEILSDADYRMIHVVEVEDLLREAAVNSPCVALVDGVSPTSFDLWWVGDELAKLGVPAVAFTAHASAKQEFEEDTRGYVGVISKPFDADEFLETVNAICWENHAVAS